MGKLGTERVIYGSSMFMVGTTCFLKCFYVVEKCFFYLNLFQFTCNNRE